jgi:AraC-like DNA-binding protein/mannose-6-phosphate isomerase-like protein (cupin superfamily)
MTDLIERYTVESLLPVHLGARVIRQRLSSVGVHWHDYYELCLVLSGTAQHVLNGESRTIGAGSAFLLSPADLHEIRVLGPEPLDCYNTVIEPAVMERQLDALGPATVHRFPWRTDDFGAAEPDLRRLRAECEEPRLGAPRLVESLVACLVVELARHCGVDDRGPRSGRPASEDHLRDAVLFVDRHFREPITLADVASRAHLSANYVSERFRQYTGTPFQLYLQERRLRFARALLAATALSVSEVCHASGFNSLSHFGRAYRRRYGAAPSAGTGHGEGRHGSMKM